MGACRSGGGFRLTEPDQLLDAWRAEAADQNVRVLLASHSVARRVAPFARVSGEFFYSDSTGFSLLKRHLQIAPTEKGENVTIYEAADDALWLETMELGSKIRATGLIQTYLDMLSRVERGPKLLSIGAKRKSLPCCGESHDGTQLC